ncbi:unnamed protein product [Adineta steineri]|uniref:mRNA-decapping enzyme C-terminal domain-containing protein n=1 Tax=Adineta steineri TaxID=433720 RepID=A0A819AY66_9BILA|nr:unnamed protein product [Adineta steineri]
MLDDKQSSIIRPKAVPPMFTPVLTPNTQSSPSTMSNNNANRMSQQALMEIGTMIRKHDPEATRLYDCIGQVKVFSYNSVDLRWENSPNIEGNLCAYERQQIINNKICPSYAFAIINGDKSFIQPITSDMVQHADKLRLFFEVARNGRREVFCLHFLTEAECLRLHAFLNRYIQALRNLAEQQQQQQQQQQQLQQQQQVRTIPSSAPIDSQTQLNGQIAPMIPIQQTPPNIYRQQMPQQQIITPNPTIPTTPQFGPSRINVNQTPTRLTASSLLAAQQQQQHQIQQQQQQQQTPHQINSYPPQMPIDLMNTNLIHLTPTIPSASIAPIEMPKPLEQIQFPPSPIPLTNGNNNNSEDPTSSLKRLLNIRSQTGLENLSIDDGPVYPKQTTPQNLLDLMPPSAFEPITTTPPSPVVAIGAERIKHRLSTQLNPIMSREHFRNVLLHLVQNDDHFLDIIYQACLTHPSTTQ